MDPVKGLLLESSLSDASNGVGLYMASRVGINTRSF